MPRNAQWTAQEDQELTKLTLTNSKENHGNLDWDEIHDLRSGQVARRSKNAMIARWWKIKEQHPFEMEEDDDDNDDGNSDEDDEGEEEEEEEDGNHSSFDDGSTVANTTRTAAEDGTMRKRRKRRHKKRKKEEDPSSNNSNNSNGSNTNTNALNSNSNPMQNIIHSILRNVNTSEHKAHEGKKYHFMEDTTSSDDTNTHSHSHSGDEGSTEHTHGSISYKNYYKHDIETLKLTSFDICQLQPYIRAFEEQIVMISPDTAHVHATAAQVKRENGNLRKTIILQNKFLSELYTKIQHQQGIVREMVECCDKMKFKMKCVEQILSKQLMDKNKEMEHLRVTVMRLEHELDTKQLLQNINNISNHNDLNLMIHFVNNLAQILQCNANGNSNGNGNGCSSSRNVNDMIHELKCKLFTILSKTEYAKNINHTKKRKRDEYNGNELNANTINVAQCTENNMNAAPAPPPRKKRKQLALPTINGNNMNSNANSTAANNINLQKVPVQPVLFTPSMTAEYQRILPPSLSAHVPPPLPPQPHNQNAQKNKYGIDLLLKVAMLDHQNQ